MPKHFNPSPTIIQWYGTFVIPFRYRDHHHLWSTIPQLGKEVRTHVRNQPLPNKKAAIQQVSCWFQGSRPLPLDIYYQQRHRIALGILHAGGLRDARLKSEAIRLAEVIAQHYRRQAGILSTLQQEHDPNLPTIADAKSWPDLQGTGRPDREWLNDLPRIILVADLYNSLGGQVEYPILKNQIIDVVSGSNSIWIWLTQLPGRMAEFSEWLSQHAIPWPDNLVAMTSITCREHLPLVSRLRDVQCRYRALSLEPLLESIPQLDLAGIHWVTIGGESRPANHPFDLDRAREVRDKCQQHGAAFFLNQLGTRPIQNGQPLILNDPLGADWKEWPTDLRIRQFPDGFYHLGTQSV